MIRPAELRDLDALLDIEKRCFTTDRLSRRSFRHILTKGHGATLVEEQDGIVRGYVMILFHAGTSLARIYSIAVDPAHRGTGIARQLVQAAEQAADQHECIVIRLETRVDNPDSIGLFQSMDYRQFGTYKDYYEDHTDALRFEKTLMPHLLPELQAVPYYRQTLDFTCGPAALLMAMHALDDDIKLDRTLELRLWRESTTIFMTSGHGGCGPYGMALAAWKRGFQVDVYINDDSALFIDSVRSAEKKEVMRLVQEDFAQELRQTDVGIHFRSLTLEAMKREVDDGGVIIVLISSYRIYKEKFPHWVVVNGFDERYIYVHDPFVDDDKGKVEMDCTNMPILQVEFERMSRYGKSGLRAALILKRR
ncbi:MAG: GNAT family N-acetyltransferase/peptidase C39 family protein [Gammaproteobacteria bacterium]